MNELRLIVEVLFLNRDALREHHPGAIRAFSETCSHLFAEAMHDSVTVSGVCRTRVTVSLPPGDFARLKTTLDLLLRGAKTIRKLRVRVPERITETFLAWFLTMVSSEMLFPKLRHLALELTQEDWGIFGPWLGNKLVDLELHNCEDGILEDLSDLTALTRLALNLRSPYSIAALANLKSLRELSIRSAFYTQNGGKMTIDVAPLLELTQLTKLRLTNLGHPEQFPSLTKLTALQHFSYDTDWDTRNTRLCRLSIKGKEDIATAIEGMAQLQVLRLRNMSIYGEGVIYEESSSARFCAALRRLGRLVELDLCNTVGHCSYGEREILADHLCDALAYLPLLGKLDVQHCFREADVVRIRAALCSCTCVLLA